MNRPVWSFRSPQSGCESIEPLLPPYADSAASPAETRLVEAHLPDCAGCRASLSWIQATHTALASRPVAVPPPDLHSRIALAIAASSAAPARLTPARVFSLRPAYAAAASLTVLGIALSYPLWHTTSVQTTVQQTPPPKAIATVPAPVVKTQTLPALKKHTLVASRTVKVVPAKPLQIARETAPPAEAPPEQVASNRVPETKPAVKKLTVKIPTHPSAPRTQLLAKVIKSPEHSVKTPTPKQIKPFTPDTQRVANALKEPVHIPVEIKLPTVTVDPPPARTASNEDDGAKSSAILGSVKVRLAQMQTVSISASRFTARRSFQGAANIMHTVDNDHTAYVAGVYTP